MDDLDKLRQQINKIDRQLLRLIQLRVKVVARVGMVKKLNGLKIRDPKRERMILDRLTKEGARIGLEPEIVKKIWRTFFRISYKIEE